jgi:hypothetical protein
MSTRRWHIQLVEEPESALQLRWAPPPEPEPDAAPAPPDESPMLALLGALRRLSRRGDGRLAWGTPLVDDPIAFLLDTTSDYVNVWGPGGELVFSNHAAVEPRLERPAGSAIERLAIGGRQLERRSLPFSVFDRTYLVEVVREIGRR